MPPDFVTCNLRRSPATQATALTAHRRLAERQVGGLSGGEQRRLGVALALLGNPEVVFLDEPSTGLEVEACRLMWETMQSFHERGGTVLLTTHYLEAPWPVSRGSGWPATPSPAFCWLPGVIAGTRANAIDETWRMIRYTAGARSG